MMPTPLPSYEPTLSPRREPFDCDSHPFPIQVLRYEDADVYSVRELNAATGEYDLVFDLDWFDGHCNAVAMVSAVDGGDAYYLLGAFDGRLCDFDADGYGCYDTPLMYETPNVACSYGYTYYYTKNGGRDGGEQMFFVTDLDAGLAGGSATFVETASFSFSGDLWAGAVLDIVAVAEGGAYDYVDDGDDEGLYLIGLGEQFEVVVVKVDGSTGAPTRYAVVDAAVDWGDHAEETADSGFGAAYVFDGYAGKRVFFTSNAGFGLFEVSLPIAIDGSCWNDDHDWEDHVFCDSDVAAITRLADAVFTNYNDGTNCPDVDTYAAPPPTASPTAALIPVAAFDCASFELPLQVLRYEDADEYTVREYNFDTGGYDLLYTLDYFDGHVNAAAMFALTTGENTAYFTIAAFDGYLCWFDEAGKYCDDDPLVYSKPNAAAILGDAYYYSKSPGDDDGESIYFVTGIVSGRGHVDDALFGVSNALFAGAVLDFVGLDEDDEAIYGVSNTYIDDSTENGLYLVGLGEQFELVVIRVDVDSLYPDAYAVIPTTVDWDGADEESGDTGFGAAYLYHAYEDEAQGAFYKHRLFFSANQGYGIFELETPVTIPDDCWNTGFDTSSHSVCDDSSATIVRLNDVVVTNYNDGMNCPEAPLDLYAPTYAPTTPDRRRSLRGVV